MSTAAGHSASPITARRRRDIEVSAHDYDRRRMWALKDPIGLRYYHLNDEEFWLLEQLDGRTTLGQLQADFERRFAPRRLDLAMLQGFLTQLHHEGLIVVDAPGQGEVLVRRRTELLREQRLATWQRPFALRFRGIDPEPWLQRAAPLWRRLFSVPALVAAAAVVVLAAIVLIVHSRAFFLEAGAIGDFLQPGNLFWFALIVGGTRLLHEASHAAACKRFGGECHEIGFMLFMLTPSAYCDVSSSWMMPSKWARMAVSAAGIGAELLVAAVAVLLWRFSEPGNLHDACLVLATLCSVNTLLINGNPLLRYDGYHVLTDWLEMPDMGRRADDVWRRWAIQGWYGDEAAERLVDSDGVESSWGHDLALALYAAASKVYLVFVVVVSLVLFQRWADRNHAHALGAAMTTAVLFSMVGMPAYRFARRWNAPQNSGARRGRRFWAMTALTMLLLAALLLVPLPRSISTLAMLRPANVAAVYVTQPGFLQSIVTDRHVAKGAVIATLRDDDLHREVLRLKAERDQAALVLQNLERRQPLPGGGSLDLPTARQALRDVEQRLARRIDDEGRLTLLAPHAGHLIAAPRRPDRQSDLRLLKTWSGSLADEENAGAYLETGVLVAEIGDSNRSEAVAVVGQEDVLFIRPGASVELLVDVGANRVATGRVAEIGRTTIGSQLDPAETAAAPGDPQSVEYQVQIAVEEPIDRATFDAPIHVKIAAPYESLGAKLLRVLTQSFRFN